MTSEKRRARQRYGAALKAQILAECDEPGASVAKVAMSHGINANVVHRWRQLRRAGQTLAQSGTGEFAPIALPAQDPAQPQGDIRIELRRGATTMSVTWPTTAAADFAAWTRELLR
jgi:transposase